MSKKQKKTKMEEELEAVSKEDEASVILGIIQKHARDISRTKMQYLEEDEHERYAMYANIESAFDLLIEDLRQEGFTLCPN